MRVLFGKEKIMKKEMDIWNKRGDIERQIIMVKSEISSCLDYQKEIGERPNKDCDFIKGREIKIYGLEKQLEILNWVVDKM
jgi:hypothetical protein